MCVHSWALEGALGFFLCPKIMCHARLLCLKFKSILTLLLKICTQCFVAFEVLCKHFSMVYEALLRTYLSGSHTLGCIGNLVRGVCGLLRCTFLGPTTSHSSSVGLGWFPGVCPPNRTFNISCGEVLVAPLPGAISQRGSLSHFSAFSYTVPSLG